jgi:hypothetical protein
MSNLTVKGIPTTLSFLAVTIRQKESNTHTNFLLTSSGAPFPEENYNLAREWMEQGLLDDECTAFIKTIDR